MSPVKGSNVESKHSSPEPQCVSTFAPVSGFQHYFFIRPSLTLSYVDLNWKCSSRCCIQNCSLLRQDVSRRFSTLGCWLRGAPRKSVPRFPKPHIQSCINYYELFPSLWQSSASVTWLHFCKHGPFRRPRSAAQDGNADVCHSSSCRRCPCVLLRTLVCILCVYYW